MSFTRPLLSVAGLCAAAALSACQTTDGGGMFASSKGPSTIVSTETMQKSVRMVDLRSGEVFFAMDVPPGKQLTWHFQKGEGDDPATTPDLMRFEVKERGNKSGKLHNAMTVPGENSRIVHVDVRQVVEYPRASEQQTSLRTDQEADRPDWWTPRGGAMPDDRRHNMYDD